MPRRSWRSSFDLATAPQLEQALQRAVSRAFRVVVDLRGLTFTDSAGVHVIVDADAFAKRRGRRLTVVRGAAQIDRLFELVGVSDRLEITASEAALSPARTELPVAWRASLQPV